VSGLGGDGGWGGGGSGGGRRGRGGGGGGEGGEGREGAGAGGGRWAGGCLRFPLRACGGSEQSSAWRCGMGDRESGGGKSGVVGLGRTLRGQRTGSRRR